MTTIATKYPFIGSIDTKQGGRHENQDNAGFVDTPLGLLLVVCDGMGGGPGGRTASLAAVDTILTILSGLSEHTPREAALKYAINKANDIIYTKAKGTPELHGMGTTVAAILINEESAVIAHVGDTRIYQLRKGTIAFRSADHSVVASLVRQKKITEEEARNHPQSNVVTRALGIRPSIEIEFDEAAFLRGDRFVVCTDGIWGMLPQQDLVKYLSRVMGIEELTTLVTDEIDEIGKRNGGGHDNLTLAIVDTPFDSEKKAIQKKSPKDGAVASKTESGKCLHWIKLLLPLLGLICVICLFVVQNNTGTDKQQFGNHSLAKSEDTITKDDEPNIVKVVNSGESIQNSKEQRIVSIPENKIGNPFQDSSLLKKEEIVHQINNIVKNLDSLKTIEGETKQKARNKKKKYVQENITPNVNTLKNKIAEEKKTEIKGILEMLKDGRTVQSSEKGKTTAEGLKHIESIKTKVKGLQD